MSSIYKVKIDTPQRVSTFTFTADTYEIAKLKALDFVRQYTVLEFYLVDRYDKILFYWSNKEKAPLHLAIRGDGEAPGMGWGLSRLVGWQLIIIWLIFGALVLVTSCTPTYYL